MRNIEHAARSTNLKSRTRACKACELVTVDIEREEANDKKDRPISTVAL
jgi:hypothetical protein